MTGSVTFVKIDVMVSVAFVKTTRRWLKNLWRPARQVEDNSWRSARW